jgi:hypothetical protein
MDDRPTEFCLYAIILGNHRVVESLFDEDGSQFAVCHRSILAVLWVLMTSM